MSKTPSQAYTEQVHLVLDSDLNGSKRLFGGTLLAWIDITAAICARRHCGRNVTTASIDDLNFIAPAYANDLVVLCAKVSHVGNTSMEVTVDSYVERLDGKRTHINSAHVVLVALDENERPCKVPALIPETEEEKAAFTAGEKRRDLRRERKKENY